MKTIFTLILLVSATSVFAAGSWKISCTSEAGINFYNDNGQAEIQFTSVDAEGSIIKNSSDVAIENYDLGLDTAGVSVAWIGKQSIVSDSYENTDNGDEVSTTFTQQVEIKDAKNKSSQTIDVVCREEIITGSGAEK
ncbi:MAG: hypothetical protein H7177_17355 [Rhizobacter sp.]|nr:hypothetical protein [Bacteriovorax sp.]